MTDDRRTADDAGPTEWCESQNDLGAQCCLLKGHAQPHATWVASTEVRQIAEAYGDARVREVLERLRTTVPDIDDVLDEELAVLDPL